ncbi:MAG TPA: hypothetical protein VKE22_04260 [Haliangiales bacterium]|nr:hypothetical protein [Haliangiales bacterium]
MNRPAFHRAAPLLVFVLAAACGGSPAEKFDAKAPDVPFVDQLNPAGKDATYDGSANCGPAVLAGIAKGHGWNGGLTDAALIMVFAEVAGTKPEGTTGNGMVTALDWLGMHTSANAGADLEWIDNELAAGHDVIALGDYYSLPNHEDPRMVSGHYIAISGVHSNWSVYQVMDPAGAGLHSLPDSQLQAFIQAAPLGGFTISAW